MWWGVLDFHASHLPMIFINIMTSSNGNIFRVTGSLCWEFTGPGEFPAQRPVTRTFDVFFDLRPNKRLSKQWWGWWFETLSSPLWRHCNELLGLGTYMVLDSLRRRIESLLCICHLYVRRFSSLLNSQLLSDATWRHISGSKTAPSNGWLPDIT